jgi:hypothetical protein
VLLMKQNTITVFTKVKQHNSVPTLTNHISKIHIYILPSMPRFPNVTVIPSIFTTCPVHPISHVLMSVRMLVEEYTLWISSVCNFLHSSVASFFVKSKYFPQQFVLSPSICVPPFGGAQFQTHSKRHMKYEEVSKTFRTES